MFTVHIIESYYTRCKNRRSELSTSWLCRLCRFLLSSVILYIMYIIEPSRNIPVLPQDCASALKSVMHRTSIRTDGSKSVHKESLWARTDLFPLVPLKPGPHLYLKYQSRPAGTTFRHPVVLSIVPLLSLQTAGPLALSCLPPTMNHVQFRNILCNMVCVCMSKTFQTWIYDNRLRHCMGTIMFDIRVQTSWELFYSPVNKHSIPLQRARYPQQLGSLCLRNCR